MHTHHNIIVDMLIIISFQSFADSNYTFWLNDVAFDCMLQFDIVFTECERKIEGLGFPYPFEMYVWLNYKDWNRTILSGNIHLLV